MSIFYEINLRNLLYVIFYFVMIGNSQSMDFIVLDDK